MIQRCLRFGTFFARLTSQYSTAISLKQKNIIPPSPSAQEDKLTYYSYHKLAKNSKLATLLSELQKFTADIGKQDRQAMLARLLMETLGKMDLDTITSKNLKIIMELISSLPSLKDSPEGNLLIDTIKERLDKNEDKEEANEVSTGLLIKLYIQNSTDPTNSFSSNITQQLINNLKASPETDLKSQQICNYFMYLNNICIASDKDRLIRLLLLRKIKSNIPTLNLSELQKYGIILNQLSHYDFLDEQLDIVSQLFSKIQEKVKQFDHQAIQRIFQAKQCLSNKDSLSKFHRSIIRTLLLTLKRHNSAQAHRIFHLVSLAPQKLKINLSKDNQGFPLEAFILQYVLISGKTKKHNKAINLALQKLIPTWFTDDTIKILQETLIVIKFKATPTVLYQLSLMKVNVVPLLEFMETEQFELKQTVLMAIIAYNQEPNKFMRYQQKINRYLTKFDKFQVLFNTLKSCQATNVLQNFDKIFGEQIRTLYSTLKQSLTQSQHVTYLDYITLSIYQSRVYLNQYNKTVSELPNNIILQYIAKISKQSSNQNIGKYLFLLKQKKQICTKQTFSILLRANKCLKQNTLKPQEKQRFWLIVISLSDRFYILEKVIEVQAELINFLTCLFKRYNNKYSEALYQGYLSNLILVSKGNIDIFKPYPQLYHYLVKLILFLRFINKKFVQSIRKIDEKRFDELQRQIIRDLTNSGYARKIQKIDETTLWIFLCNHTLHQMIKCKQRQCIEIIKRSNVKQLYRYITFMNYTVNFTYIKIYGIIIDQFSKKVNFQEVTMHPILNSLMRLQISSHGSCIQLVKKYIHYLLSPNIKIQDYCLALRLLDVVKASNISKQLSTKLIKKILQLFNEQTQQIKYELILKLIYNDHIFEPAQLQSISQIIPYKIYLFFLLQPCFSREKNENIISKINNSQLKYSLTEYQYLYLKKRYPEQTKEWNLTQNFKKIIFAKFDDIHKNKLLQISKIKNKIIEKIDFYGNQLFKINDKIIILLHPITLISNYQILFYKRLIQSIYGENFKLSIMIGFPRSYKNLHQTVKLDKIFSNEEWRDYFNQVFQKNVEPTELSNSYQEQQVNTDSRILFKNHDKKHSKRSGRRNNFVRYSTIQ